MNSVNFTDDELINGLISRDESVLKEYYHQYYKGVRRFIRSNQGNDEDARDIFHDALLVLFTKLRCPDFKLSCSPGTYLFSVARILWLKHLRKYSRITGQANDWDIEDCDGDIEQLNEKNERLIYFRKCFEELPEDCRKVLTLFTKGYSIAQITEILGYGSEKYTRNRRYRCKSTLINRIKSVFD